MRADRDDRDYLALIRTINRIARLILRATSFFRQGAELRNRSLCLRLYEGR